MKIKNILCYLAIIVFMSAQLYAQNTNPVVTNVAFTISGTTVSVTYDVTDSEQSTVTISMEVSSDAGAKWDFNYGTASGAIGAGITIGTGKIITWTYSGGYSELFKIRIIANDETAGCSPCPGIVTVVYAGKTYHTIQIGTQCWLKENLDVGTRINGSQHNDQTNNSILEKYCYDDLDANCTNYGGLYQWNEAMQYVTTEGAQGICPDGWHIPTLAEYQTLVTTVGNNSNALKAIGQGFGDGAGTNTSGFSALLAGEWQRDDLFLALGWSANFWSSKEGSPAAGAIHMEMWSYGSNIDFYNWGKMHGYSVRCIKD